MICEGEIKMSTQLITTANFSTVFNELIGKSKETINIISPFIGEKTAFELSKAIKSKNIKCRIITRFYREDFIQKVSSIEGLKYLFDSGVEILALVGLHSKLYVFDDKAAIIGSANFTTGGFYTNHELSVLIKDNNPVTIESVNHFNELWNRVESTNEGRVTKEWIDKEIVEVNKRIEERKNKQPRNPNFVHKGAKLTYEAYTTDKDRPRDITPIIRKDILEQSLESSNAWLKFVWTGKERIDGNKVYTLTGRDKKRIYLSEQKGSSIKDNDIIYITAFSYDENNIPSPMVVGRAVINGGLKKDDNRDDKYKSYFEFKQAEYIDTFIKNTINLNDLYEDTNFKKNYRQQSHISIDDQARSYLDKRLEELFKKNGSTYID